METPKRYRGKGVVFTATFEGDDFYRQSSDSNQA